MDICYPTIKIISDFPFWREFISGVLIAVVAGATLWILQYKHDKKKEEMCEKKDLNTLLIDIYHLVELFASVKVNSLNNMQTDELFYKILIPLNIDNLKRDQNLLCDSKRIIFFLNHINQNLTNLKLLLSEFNDITFRRELSRILETSEDQELKTEILRRRNEELGKIKEEVDTLLCGLYHYLAQEVKIYIDKNKIKMRKMDYILNDPTIIPSKDYLNWSRSFQE